MPIININAEKLRDLIKTEKDNLEIIDVREPEEYTAIHIKNSKLIPMRELQKRINKIDWNKKVVFLCRSGSRSALMAKLVSKEKIIHNLEYGIYECFADGKGKNLVVDPDKIGEYF